MKGLERRNSFPMILRDRRSLADGAMVMIMTVVMMMSRIVTVASTAGDCVRMGSFPAQAFPTRVRCGFKNDMEKREKKRTRIPD